MDKVFIFCPISKLGKFVKVHFQKIYFCHCSKAVTLALMMLWEGMGGLVRNCDQFQLVDSLRPKLQMMPRMVMNVRWGGAANYLDAGEINNLEVATLINQWWSRPNDQLLNSCQDQEKRSQMFRIFLLPQYIYEQHPELWIELKLGLAFKVGLLGAELWSLKIWFTWKKRENQILPIAFCQNRTPFVSFQHFWTANDL